MNEKTNFDNEEEDNFVDYLTKHAVTEKVLFTGGGKNGSATSATFIYDMKTNSLEEGPAMMRCRKDHTSATLSDDRVFVCGGSNPLVGALDSCEVFNSKTNTFTTIGIMNEEREAPAAVALPNNRVFVVGGINNEREVLRSAETFSPITRTSTICKGTLETARHCHTADLLLNNRVLVCGGHDGYELQSTEIYDIQTDLFSAGPPLTVGRAAHASTALLDGRVLITGGSRPESTELYDHRTKSFVVGPRMLKPRCGHSSSLLEDGRVLIVGGLTHIEYHQMAEIYDPKTNSFAIGSMIPRLLCHSSSSFFAPFTGNILTATKLKIK